MLGRILIGFGILLMLAGSAIYGFQQAAFYLFVDQFPDTVQQYATESSAVGMSLAIWLVAIGIVVMLFGFGYRVVRNIASPIKAGPKR